MSHTPRTPAPTRAALSAVELCARLAPAMLRARLARPYASAMLLRLRPVDAPGLGTCAVRRDGVLLVDAAWFLPLPVEVQAGLLLHESDHVLMAHADRHAAWSDATGCCPPDAGNVAADLEINGSQPRVGSPEAGGALAVLPADGAWPDTVAAPDGQPLPAHGSYEEYAARLYLDGAGGGGEDGGGEDGRGPIGEPGRGPKPPKPPEPTDERGDGRTPGDERGEPRGEPRGDKPPQPVDGPGGDEPGDEPGDTPVDLDVRGGDRGDPDAADVRGEERVTVRAPEGRCGEAAGAESAAEREAVQRARDEGRYPADEGSEAELAAAREAVREAVRIHQRTHGRGSVPGHYARVAEDATATRPVPSWQRAVRKAVRGALHRQRRGLVDTTYARPSRRSTPGGVLRPSWRGPEARLGVVVDTSGSMSDAMVSRILAELAGVVRGSDGTVLDVHACDVDVTSTLAVRDARGLARARRRLAGGGGTDLRNGITAALAQPRVAAVVVLTDGYTPWPAQPLDVPLIVIVLDGPIDRVPSWAEAVAIDSRPR